MSMTSRSQRAVPLWRVVDNTGASIRWEWRAARFADYLLQTRLKSRNNGLRVVYSITINLVPNHLDKRAHKYLGMVRQASRKYGVDESLILAIMQTESSFNPYAVSHADAMGLMQVVQHSAGRDVFRSRVNPACQAAAICLTRRITSTPVPPTWRC